MMSSTRLASAAGLSSSVKMYSVPTASLPFVASCPLQPGILHADWVCGCARISVSGGRRSASGGGRPATRNRDGPGRIPRRWSVPAPAVLDQAALVGSALVAGDVCDGSAIDEFPQQHSEAIFNDF